MREETFRFTPTSGSPFDIETGAKHAAEMLGGNLVAVEQTNDGSGQYEAIVALPENDDEEVPADER